MLLAWRHVSRAQALAQSAYIEGVARPPFKSSYLPSCDGPAQALGPSGSLVCIAQRGMGLPRASFGNLGGAIFAGLLSLELFIDSIARAVH